MNENSRICEERHRNLEEKIEIHDKRLNTHGEKLDKLENSQIRTEVVVENLCKEIESLVVAIKESNSKTTNILLGVSGFIITILVGFFIWYVQTIPR
jgi:hypothetical protein